MRPAQARADVLEVVIPRQENYDQNQEYYLLDSAHPCRILVYFFGCCRSSEEKEKGEAEKFDCSVGF